MDCERCAEDLTAYLDGELSAAGVQQIESHLGVCKACADELRSLQEAALFVESHIREIEPSSETWNLVRARISNQSSSPSLFRFLVPNGWLTAAAALAVIAALALGFWSYMRHEKDQRVLEEYMSQYIHAREEQEQIRRFAVTGSESDLHADNPFVEIKYTSFDNPFRSENR